MAILFGFIYTCMGCGEKDVIGEVWKRETKTWLGTNIKSTAIFNSDGTYKVTTAVWGGEGIGYQPYTEDTYEGKYRVAKTDKNTEYIPTSGGKYGNYFIYEDGKLTEYSIEDGYEGTYE